MDDAADGAESPRTPTPRDLDRIAAGLNAEKARYVVIGGFAMQHHGFQRPTQDIDLLIDPAEANVERIRRGLCVLPDRAVLEVAPSDVVKYSVVRVADEVVVDLLAAACGVRFEDVEAVIEAAPVVEGGVLVPYAPPEILLRTKQTIRPKDAMDRDFLHRLLAEE